MTPRPRIAPHVLPELLELVPDRVRRRLDRDPQAADAWNWQAVSEQQYQVASGDETVTLDTQAGTLNTLSAAACTCLLGPRCFHVLACLAALEIAETALDEAGPGEAGPGENVGGEVSEAETARRPGGAPAGSSRAGTAAGATHTAIHINTDINTDTDTDTAIAVGPEQRAAAASVWQATARLLAAGARSAGVLLQADMLRGVHQCRSLGLHRLAHAGLRVVQGVRQLRAADAAFTADALVDDLAETLEIACRLRGAGEHCPPGWIGVARRPFTPQKSLRLQGLFSEPVLTRSGYSGVVTYCSDARGDLLTLSDVRPADAPGRVQEAWNSGVDLGDLSASHRELCRHAVLVQNGSRSPDGRLGRGKAVRAALADGQGWNAPGVAARFARPLQQQVEAAYARQRLESLLRPAGADLLFLQGTVCGSTSDGLLIELASDQGPLTLTIAQDDPALPFRDNLELLARAPGLPLRWIARCSMTQPRTAAALAIAAGDREACGASTPAGGQDAAGEVPAKDTAALPALCLPDAMRGVLNLGIETLTRSHLSAARSRGAAAEIPPSPLPSDGLEPLRRRLRAIALGGRHSLPPGCVSEVAREARGLETQLQPTAAVLLRQLADEAVASKQDALGVRFPGDPGRLAERWLACAHYQQTARAQFLQQSWAWE